MGDDGIAQVSALLCAGDRELLAHQQRVAAVAQARRRHHVTSNNNDNGKIDNDDSGRGRSGASEVVSHAVDGLDRETVDKKSRRRTAPVIESMCCISQNCKL